MDRSKRKRLGAVLAVIMTLAAPAAAKIQCADGMLTIQADDKSLAERVCRVAEDFLDRAGKCGLRLLSPVQISIAEIIDPEQPDCVARFRCISGELLIVPPERLGELDILDAPFAAIPSDALFDSIVAHELTHALLYDVAPDMRRVRQEYLAHAFQISMLPETVRTTFMETTRFEGPRSDLISLTTLRFFPAYFAAASWGYFEETGGYCAAVKDFLMDQTPF